jgi:CBS domain-containing protein
MRLRPPAAKLRPSRISKEAAVLVRELMTTDVVVVHPSAPLKEAAQLLARHRISGVPVVESDGTVVGILSEADVLVQERGGRRLDAGLLGLIFDPDAAWREKVGARTVGEAMSAPAVVIGPNRPVYEAASRMLEEGVNRLPVIDDDTLVGIVTRADLVRAFVRDDETIEREIRDEVFGRALWLDPEQLTVTVTDGVASIFGQLGSENDHRAMTALVGRVPGVVSVDSHVATEDPRARNGAR